MRLKESRSRGAICGNGGNAHSASLIFLVMRAERNRFIIRLIEQWGINKQKTRRIKGAEMALRWRDCRRRQLVNNKILFHVKT